RRVGDGIVGGVVGGIGAREAYQPAPDSHLQARLVVGGLFGCCAAGRGVVGEGPFAAAAERQLPAAEVMAVVRTHGHHIRHAAFDVSARGKKAAGEPAASLGREGDREGEAPERGREVHELVALALYAVTGADGAHLTDAEAVMASWALGGS